MRDVLILVVAAAVVIVKVEAKSQALVGIDGKFGVNMVFTVLLVATVVVADVGIGRQRIQKVKVLRLFAHIVIAVDKEESADSRTVYEDAAQSRCIVVAKRVILAVASGGIDAVLVQVRHGVERCRRDVTETAVYRPGPHALWHLLVVAGRVATVWVEVAR